MQLLTPVSEDIGARKMPVNETENCLNPIAEEICQRRYYLKDEHGKSIEDWPKLARRVVDAICKDESEEFKSKIYDLILKTEFLPNSPCLVNAGIDSKVRGYLACFVVKHPEDCWSDPKNIGMTETIMNFGHVARSGGGVGVSLSHIRPEGDPVFGSTHAKACGPIEHMRVISEAMDSITQSGFRDMACLASLRVDHPDIFNFISCKQKERALRSLLRGDMFGQYDQMINNLDPQVSILLDKFIHNFNISVMATDNFMEKVEKDEDIDLIFNEKTYATVKASHIFDAIATNAWKNGDPGFLFYDTINNTTPYRFSGQVIEATNPCGEEPLPSWLSCNLGSIDVSKFYDDKKGEIDWERLGKSIRVVVRFLDNVIDVNKFPTKDFHKAAKENRPVGLGIMGFADLLLKMKLSYGKKKSIEIAKELSMFFYSKAHKESVSLAKEKGTPNSCNFKELDYRRNVTILSIAPTGTISQLAGCSSGIEPIFSTTTVRQDHVGRSIVDHPDSDKNYFRCAVDPDRKDGREVTFLEHIKIQSAFQKHVDAAISKCITGPSMVLTNSGLIRISDICDNREDNTFTPIQLNVFNGKAMEDAVDFYYGGKQKTIKIETHNGLTIEGTPNHKIKTMQKNGSVDFVRLDEIKVGDSCPVPFNTQIFGNIVNLPEFVVSNYGNSKKIKVPQVLTNDLSYLLGLVTAEGSYANKNSVCITHENEKILNEANDIFEKEFGVRGKIVPDKRNNVKSLAVSSRNIVRWFFDVAEIKRGAANKIIPSILLKTTKENIFHFLSGLYFDGYVTKQHGTYKIGLCLASESLIRDLQIVYLNLGIASNFIRKYNAEYNKYFYEILVYGDGLQLLKNNLNLREEHKAIKISNCECLKLNNYHLGFPAIATDILSECVNLSDFSLNSWNSATGDHSLKSAIYRNSRIKEDKLKKALCYFGKNAKGKQLNKTIGEYNGCIWQDVVKIDQNQAEVFDIYVPKENAFCANGLINHNTINMNSDATIDDIKESYMTAWKMGCKGITVYRDGSKTTQVLNTKKPPIQSNQAPKRPKQVDADIFKTVAQGFEWHVIVGKVDDNPYELFAVNGKTTLPEKGKIVKHKTRHYSLMDEDGNILIDNLSEQEKDIHSSIDKETRRFSLELRHGIPPKYIVQQIDKSNDVVTSFAKAVSRIFRTRYIPVEEIMSIAEPCPECAKNGNLVNMNPGSGCWTCPVCQFSRCG